MRGNASEGRGGRGARAGEAAPPLSGGRSRAPALGRASSLCGGSGSADAAARHSAPRGSPTPPRRASVTGRWSGALGRPHVRRPPLWSRPLVRHCAPSATRPPPGAVVRGLLPPLRPPDMVSLRGGLPRARPPPPAVVRSPNSIQSMQSVCNFPGASAPLEPYRNNVNTLTVKVKPDVPAQAAPAPTLASVGAPPIVAPLWSRPLVRHCAPSATRPPPGAVVRGLLPPLCSSGGVVAFSLPTRRGRKKSQVLLILL